MIPPQAQALSGLFAICQYLVLDGNTRPADLPPENLYAGQEVTVRNGHEIIDWFQIRKGAHQGCILSPCLFNLYAEYIMRNAGLDGAQAGIKISGRNINNLRYADDTTLMAGSEGFYFLRLQNHMDGDCSHEIKGCLLLERKAMTNLDSILKSRDITLPTKVRLVKAMYGCMDVRVGL